MQIYAPPIYEYGTWVPDLQFAGAKAGISYSFQNGRYTKIGNLVIATCSFGLSAKGASVGIANICGLPYASAAGLVRSEAAIFAQQMTPGVLNVTAFVAGGSQRYELYGGLALGTGIATSLTNVEFTDNTAMYATAVYTTQ